MPIGACLLNFHTFLKMFPVFNRHLRESTPELKPAEVLAGEKIVLAIRKLALFQNRERASGHQLCLEDSRPKE